MQCFAVWAAAVFQVRQVPHACVVCGLGVDEAKAFAVFQLVGWRV